MGPSKKLYLQDKGINSSVAVEQDIDNRATDRHEFLGQLLPVLRMYLRQLWKKNI